MDIQFNGLPTRLTPTRYNPLQVSRLVWLTERWWWRESDRQAQAVQRAALEGRSEAPQWEFVALVAMNAIVRIGGAGAKSLCDWRRAHHRTRRPAPAALIDVSMGAWEDIAAIDWAQLEHETYDAYKARVFAPLREQIYGVPTEWVNRYVETRMPPIRDATAQMQTRTRDIMVQAQADQATDRVLEQQLKAVGRYPLARVRNQVRTETSTMYNAGRFEYMAGDADVTHYKFVATMDTRTSDICRAVNGKVIAQGGLQAIPPLHFSCRTILEPLFSWENPVASPLGEVPVPGEGNYQAAQYQGFGQQDLVEAARSAKPA